jgi:hypothetical protein
VTNEYGEELEIPHLEQREMQPFTKPIAQTLTGRGHLLWASTQNNAPTNVKIAQATTIRLITSSELFIEDKYCDVEASIGALAPGAKAYPQSHLVAVGGFSSLHEGHFNPDTISTRFQA